MVTMEKKKITENQCKDTGLALILILLLISWFTEKSIYWQSAIPVLILTMTVPKIFKIPAVVWFGFSHFLGGIVSKILLTVVFFGVITPIGLLMRLFGKDSMRLKEWKLGRGSVFVDRLSHKVSAADLERPF